MTIGPWQLEAPLGASRPRSRLHTRAGRRFAWAAAASVMATAIFVAWTGLGLGGDKSTVAFDDLSLVVAALAAAGSCAVVAWHAEGRQRLAWGLLGAGVFSWFAGEAIWSVYEVGEGIAVPFPSAADIAYLLGYPLAIAGVLALPSAPGRLTSRGQAVLNGAIIALALVFISWALGLASVYETSSDQPFEQLIGAAYPVGDILVLAVLLMAVRRAGVRQRGAIFLLVGGLTAYAATDSAFAFLTASGNAGQTSGMLNAGYLIGYLLIGLAPQWPAPFAEAVSEEGPIDLWQMSAPWVALVGAAVIALGIAGRGGGLDTVLTAIAGGLGILVVASMVMLQKDSVALLADRDRTAETLERRTTTLNQVITHAPLGVARVGVDLRILDANPRLGSLLQTSAPSMVGALISDYLGADETARIKEKFEPLWEREADTVEGESPVHRAGGPEAWLHWSVTTVQRPDGRINYFLAMFEDITAKHEAEEAAMANLAGLERLNKLKSEFVSMVSHEFRTALVGIQGFSELLMGEGVTPGDVKGLASDINNDALRLNRMIGEMLDLDRMEAGKVRMNPKPVDINTLVQEAVDHAQVSSASHPMRTELDTSVPVVNVDPDRLIQVMSNLLSNAVKYSPDGGEVEVATHLEDGHVRVSVVDHGLGIAPEFIDRLFGRYERFENSRTTKVVGTGLGLSICRQIIELHGGKIWAESNLGAGSTFQFKLPVPPPAAV